MRRPIGNGVAPARTQAADILCALMRCAGKNASCVFTSAAQQRAAPRMCERRLRLVGSTRPKLN